MDEFSWTVTGTVVSIIGTGISVYLIFVTRAARDAARAASAAARKRNLVEELESASQKTQQVGNFIQQDEWAAVRMRTEEIMVACKVALTRWPDHLTEERRNEVLKASTLMRSIATESANGAISPEQKRKISDAHIRASGHISSALGEARKAEERDGDANNGN